MVSITTRPLYLEVNRSGTQYVGGWVNPTAGPDTMEKRKILPLPEMEHWPEARRYSD
jgi:hypothetical protein